MKRIGKYNFYWLIRVIFIFITLFLFQSSIIAVSASTLNLGFDPYNPVSATCTDDENEGLTHIENYHECGVNFVELKNYVGVNGEFLAIESIDAVRAGTQNFKSFSAFKRALGPAGPGKA